jgi:O-antigen ligase
MLYASRYAPHLLFLLAGILGVLLAVERGRALRELRWLIVEPLLFYALLRWTKDERRQTEDASYTTDPSSFVLRPSSLAITFVLSGAIVGLLALLQIAGLDLVPLLGRKECFAPDGGPCANVIADGSVRRALSVYGHPNNLGLYLGRVWPIAAALAVSRLRTQNREPRTNSSSKLLGSWFLVLASALCLGGIVVSFSRGAWLGALVALAVLALGMTKDEGRKTNITAGPSSFVVRRSSWRWLLALPAALVVVAGLALALRGDVTAGSTPVRLLLWREAFGYLVRHPLGIGLDQFGFYHNPESGLSLIDPALRGSSEEFAAHPHNLLLDIALRLGPLGLVAFGWLLARFFRAGWRGAAPAERALALGATAAMAGALAHGLVDNFYFVPDLAIAFWLLLALKESVRVEIRE